MLRYIETLKNGVPCTGTIQYDGTYIHVGTGTGTGTTYTQHDIRYIHTCVRTVHMTCMSCVYVHGMYIFIKINIVLITVVHVYLYVHV